MPHFESSLFVQVPFKVFRKQGVKEDAKGIIIKGIIIKISPVGALAMLLSKTSN